MLEVLLPQPGMPGEEDAPCPAGGRSQESHPLNQEFPSTSPSPQGWGRDGFYSWGVGSGFHKPVSTPGLLQAQGVREAGVGVGWEGSQGGLGSGLSAPLSCCLGWPASEPRATEAPLTGLSPS